MPYGIAFSPADGSAWVALEATGQLLRLNSSGAVTRHGGRRPESAPGFDQRRRRARAGLALHHAAAAGRRHGRRADQRRAAARWWSSTPARWRCRPPPCLQHSEKPDNTLQGRGVPNYLGAAVISPDGASAWVPSKQDNIKRGTLRDGQNLDFQNTVRAISSRIDLATLDRRPRRPRRPRQLQRRQRSGLPPERRLPVRRAGDEPPGGGARPGRQARGDALRRRPRAARAWQCRPTACACTSATSWTAA